MCDNTHNPMAGVPQCGPVADARTLPQHAAVNRGGSLPRGRGQYMQFYSRYHTVRSTRSVLHHPHGTFVVQNMFDVDLFIQCVQGKPALWEKSAPEYSDKN